MQGKVKAEHKGGMNDSRLDPPRAATREHLKEVVEVKEVQQGDQEAGLHRVNPTRSGRKPKPKGSPAIRFPNAHQVRMTLFSEKRYRVSKKKLEFCLIKQLQILLVIGEKYL